MKYGLTEKVKKTLLRIFSFETPSIFDTKGVEVVTPTVNCELSDGTMPDTDHVMYNALVLAFVFFFYVSDE